LLNPRIFADRIFYYEGIIEDPSSLVELIEATDETLTENDAIHKWNTWKASKELDTDEDYIFGYQKQTDSTRLGTSSQQVKHIYNTLYNTLLLAGDHYFEALGIEKVSPSPLSISKYVIGASMGPHVDYHGESDIEPIMSGVIYLNDDVRGGELHFRDQEITIKPKAGSIVIFPSVEPYYHESLPVESGVKYMSPVFWIKRFN
jgi:predicted 2-oxoglutarate/Fe(II)-dependent dioxygenase YbiX